MDVHLATYLAYAYVLLALLSVLGGSAAYVSAYRLSGERAAFWTGAGRHGFRLAALLTGLASVYLCYFFVTGRYNLVYVFENSSRDLPLLFKFSAFWAGQDGSFLLWATWLGILGVILTYKAGKAERSVMPFFGLVYAYVLWMVALINPYRLAHLPSGVVRADGMGLNPLLQDYWMAVHPPTLFLGYALMSVPFAFAMGALLRRDYRDWIRAAAPWAIMGASVLALALSMGGHWAYRTLGWGGFWAWDPVENSSFVPMLVGFALVHGLYLQRGRNEAAQRANIGLAVTGFVAVMYASYLTRSGVLTEFSNHSFSAMPQAWALVTGLVTFTLLGYGFFLARYRGIPSRPMFEQWDSREFGFYLSIVVLMIGAALVTLGMSAPLITKALGKAQSAPQAFYNWTMAPVGLLIALMLALYPITSRSGIAGGLLWKRARVSLVFAVLAAVAFGFGAYAFMRAFSDGPVQVPHIVAAAGLAFGGTLALGMNLGMVVRMARGGGITSAGGYIAHVGFGLLLLGIVCSSIYSPMHRIDRATMTTPGRAFGYDFRMANKGVPEGARTRLEILGTPIRSQASGPGSRTWLARATAFLGKPSFVVRPTLTFDRQGNPMTSPGIYSHPLYDIYVAPVEYDPGSLQTMPIVLRPGVPWEMGPLKLILVGISEMGEQGAVDYGMRANLVVIRGKEQIPAQPEITFASKKGTIVNLPGGSKINIDPNTGFTDPQDPSQPALTFDLAGPNSQRVEAYSSLDVTIKPLIWLVWMGMILTVTGGLLAVLRRTRDNRRRVAELIDTEETPTVLSGQATP